MNMTEDQVGLLVNAASIISCKSNPTHNLLRSYYLMRCREITKGYGLPEKYFASKIRCQHCLLEWNMNTEIKVQPIKLSKKQRRRIRCSKLNNNNKDLLKSNEIKQVCSICNSVTSTTSLKPIRPKIISSTVTTQELILDKSKSNNTKLVLENVNKKENNIEKKIKTKPQKATPVKNIEINIYSKTKDAFSLKNKSNTLQSAVKEQKVIKNNRKKKDKFAGLCQQAVLVSAKLKEEKMKQNKLNLFLKPSSI